MTELLLLSNSIHEVKVTDSQVAEVRPMNIGIERKDE
jgi:hypothetical protein